MTSLNPSPRRRISHDDDSLASIDKPMTTNAKLCSSEVVDVGPVAASATSSSSTNCSSGQCTTATSTAAAQQPEPTSAVPGDAATAVAVVMNHLRLNSESHEEDVRSPSKPTSRSEKKVETEGHLLHHPEETVEDRNSSALVPSSEPALHAIHNNNNNNNIAAREALRAMQNAATQKDTHHVPPSTSSVGAIPAASASSPPMSPSKKQQQSQQHQQLLGSNRYNNGTSTQKSSSPRKNTQMMEAVTVATKPQITNIEEEEEEEEGEEEMGLDEEEESSEISASDDDDRWISWFCSLRGNEFFVEIDEEYIQDDFNLTGLNLLVPYYDYALDMVLDMEIPMEDHLNDEEKEIVESAAEMLYGLIHARFIVTNRGMHAMYEKFRAFTFGRCPQVFCQGQPVLPVGLSDLPRGYSVNVFCPRCHGLFFPRSTRQANIDGAYFGTTFPHLYLMTHAEIIPPKPVQQYIPRVYGFRIHSSSLYFKNRCVEEQQEKKEQQRSRRIKNSLSNNRVPTNSK